MALYPDIPTSVSGLAVSSTDANYELGRTPNTRLWTGVTAVVSSPSSLVGGIFRIEMQLPDGTWVGAPQYVCLRATGGGTPEVVNGNTASAAAVTGGVALNKTGITVVSNTATVDFFVPPVGLPLRLFYDATSGTATLAITAFGLTGI